MNFIQELTIFWLNLGFELIMLDFYLTQNRYTFSMSFC